MRTILVNLERAEERRSAMTEQFRSLGMDFELLVATDWKDLSTTERALVDVEARRREGRRLLSDGMVACWLSHRRALESIVDSDSWMAAIFEDDVLLASTAKHVLEAIEQLDFDFDIIFLHRNKIQLRFLPVTSLCKQYRLGMVRFRDYGTLSYVITAKAALHLLERYPRIVHQADHLMHAYWLHGLRTFYLDPPVVFDTERSHHSFLQEARRPERHMTLATITRRISSILTKELRMRSAFRHRNTAAERRNRHPRRQMSPNGGM